MHTRCQWLGHGRPPTQAPWLQAADFAAMVVLEPLFAQKIFPECCNALRDTHT